MSALDVVLVQEASGLDPADNRGLLRAGMESLQHSPDLVVFPEVFARDFGRAGSDISEYAEGRDGAFVDTLHRLAEQHRTTIVAGMFERSEDPTRPYNTLVVVDADGLRAAYRKIHLYDSFGYKESERLLAGDLEPCTVSVGGFELGLMTCYDLRFPELGRLLVDRGADAFLVPAAWVAGERKLDHWRTLLRARAIENTVYFAAAAQPAPRYTGHSLLVAPTGDVLVEAGDDPQVIGGKLERKVLEEARELNPSLANRRL